MAELKSKIGQLEEAIAATKNPMMRKRNEGQLKALQAQLKTLEES